MASLPSKSVIASRCRDCSTLFHQLLSAIQGSLSDPLDSYQITESWVQDELGRFRVWLGNVGAHRSGRISLDYRLREAASMRDSVLELLDDLRNNIQEACEVVSGQRLPYDEIDSESSSSGSEIFEESPDAKVTTELGQTMGDIHDIISSLYEISIMLRDPAPRDRLLKIAAIDVSYFEQWDKMHIEHKFPEARPILIERLARANCKRRQYFKYLEKHHDKLALGSHFDVVREEPPQVMKEPSISGRNKSDKPILEIGPRSIAASTPTTIATKNTQTTVATFRLDEQDIYVDDTLSESSSAASEGVSEATQLQIPAPPQAAINGDAFECPYCFEMMKISGLLAWRPVDSNFLGQCPLCLKDGQQLRSHLARHLRTLALFALPKTINLDREDANSDAVQSGGSIEHEDANANFEALSDSDQMSDISEDAMIEVSKIEHQAEQLMQFDPVEEGLKPSQLNSTPQDSLKVKLARLDSAAETLHVSKPLPAFLLPSKEELGEREQRRIKENPSTLQKQLVVQQRNNFLGAYPWDNNRVRKYIATQNPKDASHFWRMVWQETRATAIVIMLEKTFATGSVYFPSDPGIPTASYVDHESGDQFTAILSDRAVHNWKPQGVLSTMQLDINQKIESPLRPNERQANEEQSAVTSKKILHYQFKAWQSIFAPPKGDHLEALISLSRASRLAELERDGSPRVVHCDIGYDNTGTFIALDFLLGEIEDGAMKDSDPQTDMIFDTVDSMGKQRMWMVPSPTQYEFLYETVKKDLTRKLALDAKKSFLALRNTLGESVECNKNEEEEDKVLRDQMRAVFLNARYFESHVEMMLQQGHYDKDEEKGKVLRDIMKALLARAGYSESSIEKMLREGHDIRIRPKEMRVIIIIKEWIPEHKQDTGHGIFETALDTAKSKEALQHHAE
ncbi:MAG: hypothetical protein Q9195_005496 [Heterodermia aff. obscurata]